ncbi:hypothetical protein [Dactylosporangium sp. NPDC051541]|uniref:hypothetical protein n=1 Tax=Dactylosporangium sp. NPDC051541 TaxID=3363977 RepID=UPI00378FFCF9
MPADPLVELIGCLAIEPDIGGVLFIDLDPRLLLPYAEVLARAAGAVGGVGGVAPEPAVVGADTTDEQLWPDWGLALTAEHTFTIAARPGLLGRSPGPLLVVPDLARAGTPVTRAIVSTLGAGVVDIERPGVSEQRPARGWWLAACAGPDLPTLSQHLLDRFPVRVDGRAAPRTMDPGGVDPAEVLGRAAGSRSRPAWPPERVDDVLDLDTGRPSVRRSLALARAARAVAARRGSPAVELADVRRAAVLVGITAGGEPVRPAEPRPPVAAPASPPVPRELVEPVPDRAVRPDAAPAFDEVVLPEPAPAVEVGAPLVFAYHDQLHPEESPGALAEPRLLRWSVTGRAHTYRPIGTVVGHERGTDFRDLAVVPTLLQSLVRTWATARRTGREAGRPAVELPDLRRRRRRYGPQSTLVLVLDHSAARDWDASPGLAPHLRWAYDQGAAVSVIEFGHAGSDDELRPERYRARSIADPRIVDSLRRPPGAASPLAAAVELAGEELRRHMHRGWASVRSARLVLVTDGRGNVPLEATAQRGVSARVAREGVDDALAVARTIAGLRGVASLVVAPVDEQYPGLTADLAYALGGSVTYVDSRPEAAR